MKRLHEPTELQWEFEAKAFMEGMLRSVDKPQEVILLLHGLNERGRRIFRKLLPYLPQEALILAPNGPYPVPKSQENQLQLGYAWYYYDRVEKKYLISQDLARSWLTQLLNLNNPDHKPVTIIGFSQGGYLAPLVGADNPDVSLVIGLGCEFRPHLIAESINYQLEAIHGNEDKIVPSEHALADLMSLRKRGIECGWHLVEGGHEISQSMGLKVQEILEAHGKRSL